MSKIKYKGYTFIPYGNIIGKDEETRYQRLMWRTDTLTPLLKEADGYDYYEFSETAKAAADIYFCPETEKYYVPTGVGLCSIDIIAQQKYIKLIEPKTQEELMAKVEAALKNSNSDEERKDDKWGLFRGLELAPLSQEMIDFLYDKEDVTEDMMEFVVEQSGDDFEYGLIDFSNMQEIACEYLDKLEYQMNREVLIERAEKELSVFIQQMRTDIISPDININEDAIIDRSYKLTVMNEMLIYLQNDDSLSFDELMTLSTVKEPLYFLYDGWQDSDINIKDEIGGVVSDTIDGLARELEDKERGYMSESEDEEDMEV